MLNKLGNSIEKIILMGGEGFGVDKRGGGA